MFCVSSILLRNRMNRREIEKYELQYNILYYDIHGVRVYINE